MSPNVAQVFSASHLAEILAFAIAKREAELSVEQSPYGTESLDEALVHPLFANEIFTDGAMGVFREKQYPGNWLLRPARKRKISKNSAILESNDVRDSDRTRCDLCLTPRQNQTIVDALDIHRSEVQESLLAQGTLFEPLVAQAEMSKPTMAGNAVTADECYWLEVKVVGQFHYVDGVPVPNRAYASSLVRGVKEDLLKLRADPCIVHAGAALVAFCHDRQIAEHDVLVTTERLLSAGLLANLPSSAGTPIPDRIGNRWCHVSIFTPRSRE
jgi:hypothetical protein